MLALILPTALAFQAAHSFVAHADVVDDHVLPSQLGAAPGGVGCFGLPWHALTLLHCAADHRPKKDLVHKLDLQAQNVSEGLTKEHGMGISAHLQVLNQVDLIILRHFRQSIQVCP